MIKAPVTLAPQPQYLAVNGAWVYPRPIKYHDDGRTAVVVKLSNAGTAADNLDAFTFNGNPVTSAVATPVAMTAGDAAASVADIAAAVEPGFEAVVAGRSVMISRDVPWEDKWAEGADFSVVTFDGATVPVSVVETRLVLIEAYAGTHFIMDAGHPVTNPFPAANPGAEQASMARPSSLAFGGHVWIPELGTVHTIVTHPRKMGGGLHTPDWDTYYLVELDPVPATNASEFYAILPVPQIQGNVRIKNTGGATATVDGQPLAAGSEITFTHRLRPFLYDATGTTLEITNQ